MPFRYDDSAPEPPLLTGRRLTRSDMAIPVARVQASNDPQADHAKVLATLQALGDPVRGVPVEVVTAWRAMTDEQRLALIENGCRWCGGLVRRCPCQRDD